MYQVYLTEGEYEPWWFFDDWKTLIIEEKTFKNLEEAVEEYNSEFFKLSNTYPYQKTKKSFLTAFWCDEEKVFCESCDDDIQIYHGVMLLKDEQRIS